MTAIVPETSGAPDVPGARVPESAFGPVTVPEPRTSGPARVHLHVDEALGVADVSVDGVVDPHELPRLAATLSCRLHTAIEQAATTVVVDLGRAVGCDPAEPALARVLLCAREGAADRGVTLDVVVPTS